MVAANASIVKFQQSSDRFFVPKPTDNSNGLVIKGFVSIRTRDRDHEIIDPSAFDIESYMAAPAVLVNHALWRNRMGNRVGVGLPISMHEVKIKSGDRDTYIVWDVRKKAEIDRYPKDRNPNIRVGDRGLYGFFRITDPDVIEKAKSGELSSFSWRGKSIPEFKHDPKTNTAYKGYSHIDMWEVSLVDVPNNPQSSFLVAKDAIHSLWFDKTEYDKESAVQALALQGADAFELAEDAEKYYAYPAGRDLREEGLLTVKSAQGVTMLVGVPGQADSVSDESMGKFFNATSHAEQGEPMAGTATTTEEVTKEAAVEEVAPVVTEAEETEETTEKKVEEPEVKKTEETTASATQLEETVAKAVEATLSRILPALTKLSDNVNALDSRLTEISTKAVSAETKEEEVVEKSALELVEEKLAAVTQQMKDVKKSVGDAVPKRAPRKDLTEIEDVVKTTTTVTQVKDPNDVFNGMFGLPAS